MNANFETFRVHGCDPKGETHMSHDVPTLEDLKADLFSYISDGHKDAHGFRPRGYDWRNMSLADLESWADRINAEVIASIEEDNAREARARADFEAAVDRITDASNVDRFTAVRWMLEAESFDEYDRSYGAGYMNNNFGVGYDYNLLTGEVVTNRNFSYEEVFV